MNVMNYMSKTVIFSILTTFVLLLTLLFTTILNPVLIKWIVLSFFLSIISSGLHILNTHSIIKSKIHTVFIPLFGFSLVIYLGFILFFINFANQFHGLIGLFIIFLMFIQLNILGWSTQKHTIWIKLLFLVSLVSNLLLSSIFFFKIDFYEIKPLLITSTLISFSLLIIGIIIHNKRVNHSLD